MRRLAGIICLVACAGVIGGCSISTKTQVKPAGPPVALQTTTKDELLAKFNRLADAVNSINAAVTMQLTAGSSYSGVIEQYHQVNGFILARKPSDIRVIGQAPIVSKNIFDMVSDGETYRIFIPSKNQFLVGSARQERNSVKPIENLRPQHLVGAIFWEAVPAGDPVLFEEADSATTHSYILTVIQPSGGGRNVDTNWEIVRKIWFDRADLNISEIQVYNPSGKMNSDVHYTNWNGEGASAYPRQISVSRPIEDYQFQIGITRLTLNEPIEASRFSLPQPPGSELVQVGEDSKEPQH